MKVEEVIDQISAACKACGARKVILFGSRAKKTALERSDIDVAVGCPFINSLSALSEARSRDLLTGILISFTSLRIR